MCACLHCEGRSSNSTLLGERSISRHVMESGSPRTSIREAAGRFFSAAFTLASEPGGTSNSVISAFTSAVTGSTTLSDRRERDDTKQRLGV